MQTIGKVKLKNKGQITIPVEIRRDMKLKEGQNLLIFKSGDRIILKAKLKDPPKKAGFLGKAEKLTTVREIRMMYEAE